MPPFEPFLHPAARASAQRATARHVIVFALVAGVCLSAAPLAPWLAPDAAPAVLASCGTALLAMAAWTLRALHRHGRVLVAVQVSAAGLVARDARGRTRAVPWTHVQHVNLCDGVEVMVRGPEGPPRLRFGADWPHVDRLARRLVRHAHAYGCTLCVDGVASHALSLAPLAPTLSPGADAV